MRGTKGTVATGIAASLAAALALAAPVATAWAGQYHVYSCRTPMGQVAPTDGWSAPEPPQYDSGTTLDTCKEGGGLIAALDANHVHLGDTERATWAFEAPAGETIAGATLLRASDTLGGSNKYAYYVTYDAGFESVGKNTQVFDACKASVGCLGRGNLSSPFAATNWVVAPEYALESPYLSLNAACGAEIYETECPSGAGNSSGYAAMVELFAADLVLSQPTAPTVSSVGGGLAEDSTVEGTSDVAFHATDSGSGVYEALFLLDGNLVDHTVLDEDGGRCRNVGETSDGLPAFLYTQPCPAELSVDVPFETTGLANGVHHLLVSVTDAAGNATTVLDREITVANPIPTGRPGTGAPRGPANGSDPSERATLTARWKGRAGVAIRGRYGAPRTIEGRLTALTGTAAAGAGRGTAAASAGASGDPIQGAQVEVGELPAYTGAPTHALAAARTATDGRWSLRLPRDLSSCKLRIGYRTHLGDALPVATRTLTLTVPAALTLHIAPRTAPSESAIRFSGRLRGGPLPAGGKQLVLEARAPDAQWIEFHVIRTGTRGRFGYVYRFRLGGPAHYQFRVLCEREADFPFATGSSNVVGVFER